MHVNTQRAPIESFSGAFRFLSNFYPSPIRVWLDDGTVAQAATVEHTFQAYKTLDAAQQRRVLDALTPGQAKRAGRNVSLRQGWNAMRLDVMAELLAAKFEIGSDLAVRLIATGDAPLVEGNVWGDRFWGRCGGIGHNHLGRLLMARRAELQRVP